MTRPIRLRGRASLALALGCMAVAACAKRAPQPGQDRPVVVMLTPSHAPPDGSDALKVLGDALGHELDMAVEVKVAPSCTKAIEAFGSGAADIGLLSVTEYLFARGEYGVVPRLQVQRASGSKRYEGEILVKVDSGIAALADLAGKKIAYVDEFSTSGFLLPAALIAEAGVKVDHEFAGGHQEALASLEAGRVDAAATFHGAAEGNATLRAIATTAPIPHEPVFVRKDLEAGLADRLVAALEAAAKTSDGQRSLADLAGVTGFAATEDAAYAELRERLRKAGVTVADLVPHGRAISWANNPILGP